MPKSKEYGKQSRIERAKERLAQPTEVVKREYDLGYDVEEGTICIDCGLKVKGAQFIYDTHSREVNLDDRCALCGLTFREANTEEAFGSAMCILSL